MTLKQSKKLGKKFDQLWKRSCVPVFTHLLEFDESVWRGEAGSIFLTVAEDLPKLNEAPASLRVSHIASANMIALYKFLLNKEFERGTAERLVTDIMELEIARVPDFLKRLSTWFMFSGVGQYFTKYFAEKSSVMNDGQYRMEYQRLGADSFSLNITNCATCTLAKKQDVQEFVPTICNVDKVLSDEFGWGLQRTQTIAKGSKHCDFVFVRDAYTNVEK
ncbi:L-2-amino-thiazoline-4-carboxylic acid hydrolase [Kordiimonas aquimaris]|uniref:L-2-amino-thiazoline-4-carboxylic acid hydrolase n=1 Tax=Kordiimonas aquimaris TaxID=707591 RepID=UPI0021CE8F1B|nr:L-2-amino-thiazoline-4-carboxylic acid hydrolase [Kordiimonas aquimaris]